MKISSSDHPKNVRRSQNSLKKEKSVLNNLFFVFRGCWTLIMCVKEVNHQWKLWFIHSGLFKWWTFLTGWVEKQPKILLLDSFFLLVEITTKNFITVTKKSWFLVKECFFFNIFWFGFSVLLWIFIDHYIGYYISLVTLYAIFRKS